MKGTGKQIKGIAKHILQLLEPGPQTIKELLGGTGCSTNTMYVYLHNMQRDGLIEKQSAMFRLK